MNRINGSAKAFSILAATILLLSYQNCSRTQFVSNLDEAALKTEDIADDSDRSAGDDGNIAAPVPGVSPSPSPSPSPAVSPSPVASPSPAVSPSPIAIPPADGNGNGKKKEDPGGAPSATPPGSAGNNSPGGKKDNNSIPPGLNSPISGLVECQMLHPNKKIVLVNKMEVQHSNASSIRICMSTNACLKVINEFAVKHSCTLDASTPGAQADAQAQCTEIFPGSRGTCHNATILSDAQVSELLKKLEPAPQQPAP